MAFALFSVAPVVSIASLDSSLAVWAWHEKAIAGIAVKASPIVRMAPIFKVGLIIEGTPLHLPSVLIRLLSVQAGLNLRGRVCDVGVTWVGYSQRVYYCKSRPHK